jgi:hypothetical protein
MLGKIINAKPRHDERYDATLLAKIIEARRTREDYTNAKIAEESLPRLQSLKKALSRLKRK